MKMMTGKGKINKAFYITALILGIFGVLATLAAIPVSTSISLGTVFPAMVGVVFIAYGIVKLKRKKPIIPWKALRIIVTIAVCIGIVLFSVIEIIIIVYANTKPPDEDVNFVIVLGAGIFSDGRLSLSLKIRLDNAKEYLDEHEDTICIVSGGQGENEPVAEAFAMKEYLVAQGIEQGRIITEANSFSTHDNMTLSAQIMEEDYPQLNKTAVIVTSDFHIFRSLAVAKNRGITGFGLSCHTPLRVKVTSYMREFLTIINTYLFQMN